MDGEIEVGGVGCYKRSVEDINYFPPPCGIVSDDTVTLRRRCLYAHPLTVACRNNRMYELLAGHGAFLCVVVCERAENFVEGTTK
jgi:hypothetical protein